MIKALFIGYTGAIIQHRGKDFEQLMNRIVSHSNFKNTEEAGKWITNELHELEKQSVGEKYICFDDICMKALEDAEREHNLKDNKEQLHTLAQNYLMYAPVYDDVHEMMNLTSLPLYVVTDCGEDFVRVCMRRNNLHPFGIYTSERVKCYKPDPEIYRKAAEEYGFKPEDILYIGASLEDVKGAASAGMKSILVDRNRRHRDADVQRVRSLVEILAHMEK